MSEGDITQRQAHLAMEAVVTKAVTLRKLPTDAKPKVWQNHGRHLAGYESASRNRRAALGVGLSWRASVACAIAIIDRHPSNP